MPKPKVEVRPGDKTIKQGPHATIRCPECGIVGTIDEEQYRGEVSIDCPKCDYHETHDLRETGD